MCAEFVAALFFVLHKLFEKFHNIKFMQLTAYINFSL